MEFGLIFKKDFDEGVEWDEEDDETEGEYYVLTILLGKIYRMHNP